LQSFTASCRESGLPSPVANRRFTEKTRRKMPVVRPFQERRLRSTAKDKNKSGFIGSFGRTNDPFPTLLAGSVNIFSFWYEGKENESIIDYARYKAIGNSIAVSCAEYIMAGIAESL